MNPSFTFLGPTGAQISPRSRLGAWARTVNLGILQEGHNWNCVDRLRAASGEVSLNSRWGRWAMRLSREVDDFAAGFPNLHILLPLLKGVGGEQSLRSPVGKWDKAMSGPSYI